MRFHLGTNNPMWLWHKNPIRHPLFVSHRRLAGYKTFRKGNVDWALDSGGFTELNMYGEWRTTPAEYVAGIHRYQHIGRLQWASQQDWMCETQVLNKTGRTILEHQTLTVNNLLELRSLAPELPIIPVLQGWTNDDYLRHVDMFTAAGINLTEEPVVGIGSVCRRANVNTVGQLIIRLADDGIRLHGFGIKQDGVRRYGYALTSSDSMAWSASARHKPHKYNCGQTHNSKTCTDCVQWAQMWADRLVANIDIHATHQQELF